MSGPSLSIIYTFPFGALGRAASNAVDQALLGKAAKTMVNFRPRLNGTVYRRCGIKLVPFTDATANAIKDILANNDNVESAYYNLRLFSFNYWNNTDVAVLLSGSYFSTSLNQKVEGHLIELDSADAHIIENTPYSETQIQDIEVNQTENNLMFCHVDVPSAFAQYSDFTPPINTAPTNSVLHFAFIDFLYGPSEEPNDDQSLYVKALGSDLNHALGRIGIDVKMKFHYSIGVIAADDLIGGVYRFKDDVEEYEAWTEGGNYPTGSIVSHDGNLYLLELNYKPRIGALPPIHYDVGEVGIYGGGDLEITNTTPFVDNPGNIGRWLYLNSGIGYAKLKEIPDPALNEAIFTVQKCLPPRMCCPDDTLYHDNDKWGFFWTQALPPGHTLPNVWFGDDEGLWEWAWGSQCARFGYFRIATTFARRAFYGGGRDYNPYLFDTENKIEVFLPTISKSIVWASSILDWTDMDQDYPGKVSAYKIESSTKNGSSIAAMVPKDTESLIIASTHGMSLIGGDSSSEGVDRVGSADFKLGYGSRYQIYNGQQIAISADRKTVIAKIFSYDKQAWGTRDLLSAYPEITRDTEIKNIVSINGSPALLLIVLKNGRLFVRQASEQDSQYGFFEINVGRFVVDVALRNRATEESITVICGFEDTASDGRKFQNICEGILNLGEPGQDDIFIDWGSQHYESLIELGHLSIPGGISQSTQVRADKVLDAIIDIDRGEGFVNGGYVKEGITRVPIHCDVWSGDIGVSVKGFEYAYLDISSIEVSYTVRQIGPLP